MKITVIAQLNLGVRHDGKPLHLLFWSDGSVTWGVKLEKPNG